MHTINLQAAVFALLGSSIAVQAVPCKTDYVQPVQDQAFSALEEAEPTALLTRNSTCTLENAAVRKNWWVMESPRLTQNCGFYIVRGASS